MNDLNTVLFIAGWLPNEFKPQSGDFILYQAQLLREEGVHLDVIGCDLQFKYILKANWKFKILSRSYKKIEYDVLEGPGYPNRLKISYDHWYKKLRLLFIDYKNRNGLPRILHAHTSRAIYAASKLKKEFQIPYIGTIHSSNFLENKFPSWHDEHMDDAFNQAEKIIAVSTALREAVDNKYSLKNSLVIPNFTNTDLFSYSEKKDNVFTFISTGNMHSIKRYDILIHAFKLFLNTTSNCQLILVGDGKETQKLKSIVSNLGLEDKITFTGEVDQNMISQLLKKSHVYIQTSRVETFCMSILEALFTGIPILSTDSLGPRDLINSNNGILMKKDDSESIASEMLTIFNSYTNFNPQQIEEMAKNLFSPRVVAQKYKDIYKLYFNSELAR